METAVLESKHTGRPKGKGNLSEDVKLGIVQEKKLQLMSQSMIADQFNVARFTVNRITEDDLKPETKAKLDSFVDKLSQAREKVIQRINEKLDNNDFKDGVYPNLLNAVNNNFRLETNQSTANVNVQESIVHSFIQQGIASTAEEAEAMYKALESGDIADGES